MNTNSPDPADAIAEALSRLRGRRPGLGGPRGPRGPVFQRDHRERFPDHEPHQRGERWWAEGASRAGAPAIIRLLETLAASNEPMSVSALGEAIGVDQPRASRLVQQGVSRGVLAREADPEDARRTRIALTERGKHFTRGLRTDRREALRTALDGFTEQERSELARLLNKLADNWHG